MISYCLTFKIIVDFNEADKNKIRKNVSLLKKIQKTQEIRKKTVAVKNLTEEKESRIRLVFLEGREKGRGRQGDTKNKP